MFTGLVEDAGRVASLTEIEGGAFLRIETRLEVERGDSVSVNGVCLTLIPCSVGILEAALSSETLSRTTLGELGEGSLVNLERALAIGDRLGGHLVQGHVDGVGQLLSIEPSGDFATYRWSLPDGCADLVIEKGSIAVDGISLTVIEPAEDSFGVALIPETLERTNLRDSRVGDRVNLELDMMAKYARSLVMRYLPA